MKLNADNLIVGRFATVAAKRALLGEQVEIINCATAVVSGRKKMVQSELRTRASRGTHRKGPFYSRQPDRFVKRMIRGMLPHRQPKGLAALKRIRCYSGVPDAVKVEEFQTLEPAHVRKLRSANFIYIRDLCRIIGGQ